MTKLDFKPLLRLNVYVNTDEYYLETEKAIVDGREVVFESPVPFRSDHLKLFADAIHAQDTERYDYDVIPTEVLFHRKESIITFTPPGMRELQFTKSLKVPDGLYPIPGLIFVFSGYSLSVFAYKGNQRPDGKTRMFKAPFYNVYAEGSICMGGNRIHELTKLKNVYKSATASIELFFKSFFSHYSDTNKLNGMTLEELYRGDYKPFPEDNLIDYGKDLETYIQATFTKY